jgi:hypothetical protein
VISLDRVGANVTLLIRTRLVIVSRGKVLIRLSVMFRIVPTSPFRKRSPCWRQQIVSGDEDILNTAFLIGRHIDTVWYHLNGWFVLQYSVCLAIEQDGNTSTRPIVYTPSSGHARGRRVLMNEERRSSHVGASFVSLRCPKAHCAFAPSI